MIRLSLLIPATLRLLIKGNRFFPLRLSVSTQPDIPAFHGTGVDLIATNVTIVNQVAPGTVMGHFRISATKNLLLQRRASHDMFRCFRQKLQNVPLTGLHTIRLLLLSGIRDIIPARFLLEPSRIMMPS